MAMFKISAANATSGPVAPVEHLQSRTVAPVVGHGAAMANHDARAPKAPEPAADSSAGGQVVAGGAGDKSGKTGTGNAASNPVSSASAFSSAFNFYSKTRRVVMQLRDGNGAVVVQIPSEQALRQYEQALKQVKDGGGVAQDGASAAAQPVQSPPSAVASSGSATAGAGARYNIVV